MGVSVMNWPEGMLHTSVYFHIAKVQALSPIIDKWGAAIGGWKPVGNLLNYTDVLAYYEKPMKISYIV